MQEPQETIVITRGTIGQWASFAGMTFLLLGGLAWLWLNGFTPVVGVLLALGIAGIALWGFMVPQEFVAFFTGRQARYGTISVLSTLLMIGIVTLTYILLEREVITLDLTERGAFSLSNETLDVLDRVEQPMRITGFYSPRLVQQQEVDDQFFRLYETATGGLISREYINPIEQPSLAQTFQAGDGSVYVSYVNLDGSTDLNTLVPVTLTGTQERDMTNAILRLLNVGSTVVYFDNSLGELNPLDGSARGLSTLTTLLQGALIGTLPLDLEELAANGQQIPDIASAVILARPVMEPSPAAIAVLDQYLRRGGGLLILADTQTEFMTEGSPFSQYMWDNWGLRLMDAVVVDDGLSGETNLDIISYAITDSEITASIDPAADLTTSVQFRIARPIVVNENPPVPNGSLIQTSPQSYAETNLGALFGSNTYGFTEGEDIRGPLTTVAYAEDSANTGARIVLVGDSDFVTNGQILSPRGNTLLVDGALSWMSRYSDTVSISPEARITGLPVLFVASQTLDAIAFVTVIVMPGIALALGVFVWYRRSRL